MPHYKPRELPSKVETEKFEIDYRLLDLLDLQSKRFKRSRNSIVEWAIIETCKSPSLEFAFKRRKRKKFLVRQETLDLLERSAARIGVSKNALLQKCLKNYLLKKVL